MERKSTDVFVEMTLMNIEGCIKCINDTCSYSRCG